MSCRLALMGFLFCIISCAALTASGGNGALPQAVIPNELVTVSSSDEVGYVSITGAEGAVSGSATVIVTAGNSSAAEAVSYEAPTTLGLYGTSVSATTCSNSVIPACSELSTINKCQVLSNEDGSFTVDVPAVMSDLVTVDYLDPESCQAKNILQNDAVPDNVPPLGMEAFSIASHNEQYYVYGTVSGVHTVLKVDPTDRHNIAKVAIEAEDMFNSEVPQHIDIIYDQPHNRDFVILTTNTKTVIGLLDRYRDAITRLKPVVNVENIGEKRFFYQDHSTNNMGACDVPSNPQGEDHISLLFTAATGR